MDHRAFEQVLQLIEQDLNPAQRIAVSALATAVNHKEAVQTVLAVREAELERNRLCPQCGATGLVRHGKDASGLARFRCPNCGKRSTALTGTVLVRIQKRDLVVPFLKATLDRHSLSRITEDLPLSIQTALTWRHLLLGTVASEEKEALSGIVEADEAFFLESHKGSKLPTPGFAARPPRHRGSGALRRGLSKEQVPVVTALDRTGGIVEGVLSARNSLEVRRVLAPSLSAQSALCSDGFSAYEDLATARNCAHFTFKPSHPTPAAKASGLPRGRRGALGLGLVNGFHEVLKTSLDRLFRGVSTRFLANYAALERLIRQKVDALGLLERLLA